MILLDIFTTFFKLGLFSIGGGFAMLSLIQREVTEVNAWVTSSEFIDIVTISEIIPGPVSINSATYIGYKMAGIAGSVVATIAVVMAPVIIMIIITRFFIKFQNNEYLGHAFLGLRPVTVGLIAAAAITIAEGSFIDFNAIVICLTAFFASYKLKIDPLRLIIVYGVIGYVLY